MCNFYLVQSLVKPWTLLVFNVVYGYNVYQLVWKINVLKEESIKKLNVFYIQEVSLVTHFLKKIFVGKILFFVFNGEQLCKVQ